MMHSVLVLFAAVAGFSAGEPALQPVLELHPTRARVGEGWAPPGFEASQERHLRQREIDSTLLAANEEQNFGTSSDPREPPSGVTGVMVAAMKGYAAVIKALLAAGSDINAQDSDGKTALLWALDNGQAEAAQVLLDSGAHVNVRTNSGETALASAARSGDINSVRALLGKGADVNAQNSEGSSSLMHAARNGHTNVLKALLDARADPNVRANDGKTALMLAAWNGHTDIVRALLDSGSIVDAKSNDGGMALTYAASKGHGEIVELLQGSAGYEEARRHSAERLRKLKQGKKSAQEKAIGGAQARIELPRQEEEGQIPMTAEASGPTETDQRLADLLARAEQQFAVQRLSSPAGGNALETYREVLQLVPGHEQALEGIVRIKARYGQWAKTAARRGDWAKAQVYLEKAVAIDPQDSALAARLRKLKQIRKSALEKAIREAQARKDSERLARRGHAQPPPHDPQAVTKIERVAHEFIGNQSLPTASIQATIAGAVHRMEVFVETDQGFSPHTMYDDGTHGDPIPGDGEYRAEITLAYPSRGTRYYVVAYVNGGLAVYKPAPAGTGTYLIEPVVIGPSVVINEFMARNNQTIADPQGDYDGWIELYNTSSATVELTGYYLSDDPENAKKWRFPDGTRLSGYGYLIVWADREPSYSNVSSRHSELHANFELSKFGEHILLSDTDNNGNGVLDSVSFGRQRRDTSMGRSPNGSGEFEARRVPTPGWMNQ